MVFPLTPPDRNEMRDALDRQRREAAEGDRQVREFLFGMRQRWAHDPEFAARVEMGSRIVRRTRVMDDDEIIRAIVAIGLCLADVPPGGPLSP